MPGFDDRSPFRNALDQASENFLGGLALMLVFVVTLLPWALLALLVWWIVRTLRPRFARSDAPAPVAAEEV